MKDPVDLTHLRELTEGDEEMERSLFELFFSSSEECIALLQVNCTDGENIEWKKQAHAFKGSAVNMGAETLGGLCSHAQESFAASLKEKQILLEEIKKEYTLTKEFLQGLY